MKRQRVDSEVEKRFILALIVSKEFLSGARNQLDLELIQAPHLREVARWCFDYFDTHNKAPGRDVEHIYFTWHEKQPDDDPDAEAIGELLGNLSGAHEDGGDVNAKYLLDELGKYVSHRSLARLADTIEGELHRGNLQNALQELQRFRVPQIGRNVGIDPLNDPEVWKKTFAQETEPIITFPGDAGRFLNPAFTRESLIGIQAPEKRGKTFWCLEFAIRALQQRRKVAFFEVGDLSQGQILRRLGVRLTNRPLWPSQCGEIEYPISVGPPPEKNKPPVTETRRKECPYPLSEQACEKARGRFFKRCGIPANRPYLLMSDHPTGSINVRGIETILDGWEAEKGFVPDVIVVDYADILAPENTKQQFRDQVNETWAALRRLSQERRCLVIAPTQANAASYGKKIQTMANFSEDKRKIAHVTGLLGLNQTDLEKSASVMRLNWIVLRESPFKTLYCLWVGQCLALGKMMTCSKLV